MEKTLDALGRRFNALAILCALALIALALGLRVRHDYIAYVAHWQDVLAGANPWTPRPGGNAYGPLYNLFAVPMAFHVLLPRVLFVFAWIACCYLVTEQLSRSGVTLTTVQRGWLLIALFGSPFGWLLTARYGMFDSVVALCSLVCVFWHRQRPVRAGIALAAAFLLKVYPIALLPFVAWNRDGDARVAGWSGRLNAPLLLSFVAASLFVCAVTAAVWGDAPFWALRFASERPSTLMSIFRFLDGTWSPLQALGLAGTVTSGASVVCLVGSLTAVSILHLWRPFEPVSGCTCALLLVVISYKAGHFQFRILPVLLVVWLLLRDEWPRAVVRFGVIFIAWHALVVWGYPTFKFYEREFAWIREIIGLPTFVIELGLLVVLLRAAWLRASGVTSRECLARRSRAFDPESLGKERRMISKH